MSTVSQIITFRKGRAYTERKPSPPAPPAPPAAPSATVTIGAPGKLSALTYEGRVQRLPNVEIDTRPPRPGQEPAEQQQAAAAPPAPVPPPPPPPPPEPARPAPTPVDLTA